MPLTDFFLATPDELRRACSGWPAPLDAPRVETRTNPFTKKPVVVRDWTPHDADFSRSTLAPDCTAFPSIDVKGIGVAEVRFLVSAALDVDQARARELDRPPLIAPPECESALCEVPGDLVRRLASADSNALDAIAQKWDALERADIAGIEDKRTREAMLAERTLAYWKSALAAVAAVARQAAAEKKGLYYWMSP
jgi:hypothetical protein